MDVDQPYLLVARRSIADKLGAGSIRAGFREAWAMMAPPPSPGGRPSSTWPRFTSTRPWPEIGTTQDPLPAPTGSDLRLCGGRLAEV